MPAPTCICGDACDSVVLTEDNCTWLDKADGLGVCHACQEHRLNEDDNCTGEGWEEHRLLEEEHPDIA